MKRETPEISKAGFRKAIQSSAKQYTSTIRRSEMSVRFRVNVEDDGISVNVKRSDNGYLKETTVGDLIAACYEIYGMTRSRRQLTY